MTNVNPVNDIIEYINQLGRNRRKRETYNQPSKRLRAQPFILFFLHIITCFLSFIVYNMLFLFSQAFPDHLKILFTVFVKNNLSFKVV